MAGLDRGAMDRLVRIERKVEVEGLTSAGKGTWELVAEVWAEVRDVRPSRAERSADGLTIANRPAIVRIEYLDGLTANMRIVDDTRIMAIVSGPAMLGRYDGWEIGAEDYSTAGGPA